jgi:hypothetical protein
VKKFTEGDARLAVQLCEAVIELPKVRRALSDKPGKYHDAIHLELSAAEISGGEGQGSGHYFYVSPEIGRAILDAAERIIRDEMNRLGVEAPK